MEMETWKLADGTTDEFPAGLFDEILTRAIEWIRLEKSIKDEKI